MRQRLKCVVGHLYVSFGSPGNTLAVLHPDSTEIVVVPDDQHAVRTLDYVRHGTTTLFAALEIATGEVTGLCRPRHRNQEFLVFRRHVARGYPDQDLHLIMDSYAAHKHRR